MTGLLVVVAVAVILVATLGGRSRDGLESKDAAVPARAADKYDATESPSSVARSLSGISEQRKRKIVTAAFACQKADFFRRQAEAVGGARGGNALPGLSEVQRRYFQEAESVCASDPAARTAPVDDFLADLAQGGNMAAASCYLAGGIRERRHGIAPPDNPRYRQLAPVLVERGVRAGSWAVVSQASAINSLRSAGSPYIHLPPPDLIANYRYTRLKQIGAVDNEKLELDAVLTDLAKALPEAAVKKADKEAEELFRSHFTKSGPYRYRDQTLCDSF
ncbi:hypothetical protein [Lysobacter antibioticus]|uniref:hypothetical protein n=1 Tax=Lysobacter antibioticus TaxID=84531 RepID=UPI0011407A7B|nr:hypothetical protein [Lysobacter antibioticus]